MANICWYFQLHQPYRLRDFTVFDVGQDQAYFSTDEPDGNQIIFQKVAQKSYLPMLELLLKLLKNHPTFCFTLSCSGVFLEQAQTHQPKVITLLQKLVKTGRVEILAETYYHSLASLYSPREFVTQVKLHTELIQKLFKVTPTVFRNTELIYSNKIGNQVAKLGFIGMLTEGVDRYLKNRPRTQVWQNTTQKLPLLLKQAELSDDIAFRFSDKNWQSYPLTANMYASWLNAYFPEENINLFMDFETFGEHQWASTGIFEFFTDLIGLLAKNKKHSTVTPHQVFEEFYTSMGLSTDLPIYDVPKPISWADVDRDLTAWTENALQQDSLRLIYELEKPVLMTFNRSLIETWRKLQTSDHFYYMCTKWAADGDVHAYFSPYDSPYEAYRRFATVLSDLKQICCL